MIRITLAISLMVLVTACAEIQTKGEAFPKMYSETEKPISILVVPAINKSTAADAATLVNSTLTVPFVDNGYYVLPISIVSDIFEREGIVEGTQLKGVPLEVFKSNFGADSVLYITINKWDTNYVVIAANVVVGMSYVLVSTTDNEVLWSYEQEIVVDTSGDSTGFIVADILKTAITTAMTDYIPIARRVNATAVATMPFGKYHPLNGKDAEMKVVLKNAKDMAAGTLE